MYWRLEQLFKMNKRSLHNFIFIMGIISTVVTLLTSFSTDISNLFSGYEVKFLIKLFIGVFILSIIWSFILIFKITFKVTNKTEMTISVGDIFEKKGVIVIPVNEYFDTKVSDSFISKETLHGKFIIKYFPVNDDTLKKLIDEQLKNNKFYSPEERVSYPLGTTIKIEKDGQHFFLVALSKSNDKNKAYLNLFEYNFVLNSLISYIHDNSHGRRVHIPLIGNGQSGIQLTEQRILENLINIFKIREDLTASGGIEVVIYKTDIKEINLERTRVIANG